MLNKVKELIKIKKMIEEELVSYFKDKNISLDDRWEVFKLAVDNDLFVNINCYYWTNTIIENELKLEWYDDFNIDRYQSVTFTRVITKLLNHHKLKLEEDSDVIKRIKEDMLQSGYSGFRMDW